MFSGERLGEASPVQLSMARAYWRHATCREGHMYDYYKDCHVQPSTCRTTVLHASACRVSPSELPLALIGP